MKWRYAILGGTAAAAAATTVHDLVQKKHAILRNYPVDRARALLAGDGSGPSCGSTSSPATTRSGRSAATSAAGSTPRPSRRTTTSASAPTTTSSTRRATRSSSTAPSPGPARHDAARAARRSCCPRPRCSAAARGRAHAFRPASVVNISGDELRRRCPATPSRRSTSGAAMAGCLQNTGEGGLSPHHRNGGDLVFQIGTSYFGCRDEHGRFDLARLKDVVAVGAGARDRDQALARAPSPGSAACCPAPR